MPLSLEVALYQNMLNIEVWRDRLKEGGSRAAAGRPKVNMQGSGFQNNKEGRSGS